MKRLLGTTVRQDNRSRAWLSRCKTQLRRCLSNSQKL